MATTQEEVQRAIERAREAGDKGAVTALEDYHQRLAGQKPAALSENERSGAALSDAERIQQKNKAAYEADAALRQTPAGKPTPHEIGKFRHERVGALNKLENLSREVVKDPTTGKVRWAALSPDRMAEIEHRKELEKAGGTALKAGFIRWTGERVEDVDEGIERRRATQKAIFEQLAPSEQERVRDTLKQRFGSMPVNKVPAHDFREVMEENPDNKKILDDIVGDEWGAERKEFWKRVGNRLTNRSFMGGTNLFGADDPGGDIMGPGKYEGIEYGEDEQAPLYDGASKDIRDWKTDSKYESAGLYEYLMRPFFSKDGVLPGKRIREAAESMKEKGYTEEQLASVQKRFIPEGMGIKDIFKKEMWNDPNTKLPWNDWDGFYLTVMENAAQIGVGVAASYGGGKFGAREGVRMAVGKKLVDIEKTRRRAAGAGGVVAGGATEGLLIHDNVASGIRDTLNEVPMGKVEADPKFQQLLGAGFTPEEAKQVLVRELASAGGVAAFLFAGILAGSPMAWFFGLAGAGRLGSKIMGGRVAIGALGEPLQEGTQEVIEGEVSDISIARIDPENPIFADKGRRLERFAGGFLISAPTTVGAIGAIEPSKPAGLEQEDQDALNKTSDYYSATNERYAFELKISNPDYIEKTDPQKRLQDMQKLENLQKKEAQLLIDAEPTMRDYIERTGFDSKAELKMLDALKLRANVVLTDIAVARSRRQSSVEMVEEQQQILNERNRLQKKVTENLMKLEDVRRLANNIEAVQQQEALAEQDYDELRTEGYGAWRGANNDQFVILPKGKRALNLLMRQDRDLSNRLDEGYTEENRRRPENTQRRELIEAAGPAEREQLIYQDPLTGVQNRRAFDERTEDAPAVAAVDVDSLKWINDNMSHAAGDRLLVAVADAIEKQSGVEVFRLGGDEFAVTGANQDALETALQAAATELADIRIGAGKDQVIPQITWGKGATYDEADIEAASMKADRIQRGVTAKRKGRPATYSQRDQLPLFHQGGEREEGDETPDLLTRWRDARNTVARGDTIEVLTPDGAVQGVITNISRRRSKPRITAVVSGRRFTFNPERNHLITARSNRADIAWLTGDAELVQPDRETIPQIIPEVQIGHLGYEGYWYADISETYKPGLKETSKSLDVYGDWWESEYPEWSRTVPYVYKLPEASDKEMKQAEAIVRNLTAGYKNLPPLTLVRSIAELEQINPELVQKLKDHPGASLSGVRGFFDEEHPENGVVILVANIPKYGGSFDANFTETLFHEMIGHYGIRGLFGDEINLRKYMHEIVDAFPRVAGLTRGSVPRQPGQSDEAYKQLVGEEMIAYITGEMLSGTIELSPPQRTVIQRFFDWIRQWFTDHGWGKYFPESDSDSRYGFWNDQRVQSLIARAQDFVRNGNGWSFNYLDGRSVHLMRDADIFQLGTIQAVNNATKTLSKRERKQLESKYESIQEVPKEVPLFPETGSPNAYRQAVILAAKQNLMTNKELELTNLSEKEGETNFFRDATYADLKNLNATAVTDPDVDVASAWFKEVMPPQLAEEFEQLLDVAKNPDNYVRPDDRAQMVQDAEARIGEVLNTPIDQKKTRLTRDHLLKYLASEKVVSVTVVPSDGFPQLDSRGATMRLFGPDKAVNDDGIFDRNLLTEEEKQMVGDEIAATRARGYDVGFDENLQIWADRAQEYAEYQSSSPEGSNYARDYRVVFIKQRGGGLSVGRTGHFDSSEGVLVHVRTGLAEVMEVEGQEMPIAMRKDMENKLLSLVEQQTDWLQHLRKAYKSSDEKENAVRRRAVINDVLRNKNKTMGESVTADFQMRFDTLMDPAVNINLEEYEAYVEKNYAHTATTVHGVTGAISQSVRDDAYKTFRDQKIEAVISKLTTLRDFIDTTFGRYAPPPLGGLAGSLDARAFEMLDKYAVGVLASHLYNDVESLIRKTRDLTVYNPGMEQDRENFNASLHTVSKNMLGVFNRVLRGGMDGAADLRLPVALPELKKLLTQIYEAFGIEDAGSKVDSHLENMKTVNKTIYKIPMQRMNDFANAMESPLRDSRVAEMVHSIFNNAFLMEHDVSPNRIQIATVFPPSGESIDIEVTGDQDALNDFGEKIETIIHAWIDQNASNQRTSQISNNLRRATEQRTRTARGGSSRTDTTEIAWNDIVNEWDIEEHDVDFQGTDLDDEGVYSYEEFAETRFGDELDEMVRYEIDENTDWNEITNSNGESLDREGEAYRERLDIDGEGNVDNTDAEEWLQEERDEHETEVRDSDWMAEQVNENIRNMWDSDPAMLYVGEMPTEWDQEGDPTETVKIVLKQENYGESVQLQIDDIQRDTWYSKNDAFSGAWAEIGNYYDEHDIISPVGTLFGAPAADPQEMSVEAKKHDDEVKRLEALPEQPNWDIVKNSLTADIAGFPDKKGEKTAAMFGELVVMDKRSDIATDTPLKEDKYWRNMTLKYLLADAVRRGLPGVVWNPGLATSARGGAGFEGVATDRINWSLETITIRGEPQDVWIVSSPNLDNPIAVSKAHSVPILGGDVAGHIAQQIEGRLPLQGKKLDANGQEIPDEITANDFMISLVGDTAYRTIHERRTGRFLATLPSQDEATAWVELEIQERSRGRSQRIGDTPIEPAQPTPIGEVKMQGDVTSVDMGGKIRIITGLHPSYYTHTFGVPTLAGARTSYEEINPRLWNKTLKKYGVQIGEIYVRAKNVTKAEEREGARIKVTTEREDRIKEDHGRLSIEELRGETHGWIIMSEKQGAIYNEIYVDRTKAERHLRDYIYSNFGDPSGGVKVAYIPINAKIREEFSGPVPPFHYDPRQDPTLQSAAEKIGYEEETLTEKYRAWKEAWKDHFNQGVFDRFYGIKRALKHAGVARPAATDPYIQTRLTTSLDSMMKAIFEYGHPVWRDGIMQTEGRGLLDILQPVMNQVDLWSMYMAGTRAKRLLLEGYDHLDADSKAKIDKAAEHFDGKTHKDKVMRLLAHLDGYLQPEEGETTRREFLKMLGAAGVAASVPKIKGVKGADAELEKIIREAMLDPKSGRYTIPGVGRYRGTDRVKMGEYLERIKQWAKKTGTSQKELVKKAAKIYDKIDKAQVAADEALRAKQQQAAKTSDKEQDIQNAQASAALLVEKGREKNWTPAEIFSMNDLGVKYPVFKRTATDYAAFHKKVLDFAQEAGVINPETRPLWENADYVPFYRVQDDRLVGPLSGGAGIANQKQPIKRLKGGEANVGDITHNIFVNLTKLIDTSMKNNAALLAVDALRGTGIVSKKPMTHSQELIPLQQVKKLLIDRGMNPDTIPMEALTGFQKMFAVQPPEGPGVISVLRDGKREFYYTDDELLYRSMTNINKKAWGRWMSLFRAPKRALTVLVTLDPGFMIANFIRDSMSGFVLSRDKYIPVVGALKGFGQALVKDDAMRTMLSAGAAFESGYINQYDPQATHRLIKRAMRKKSFARTILNSPAKLYEGWKAIGSATENANRLAVYNAALRAGKGKAQAAYEAKDLMDFSMGGDWPFIQFLIQTVPFMGARMQGLHRMGRGFTENPVAFAMKGSLIGMAGLALWFAFKDDERYKELEDWDKDIYFHWWIGDNHYRLPKGFEVGALFNTVPERTFEYMYSQENDAGKLLMKRWGFMLAETFNFNPVPQTFKPLMESYFNYNFFTGRQIVSPYEQDRMSPEEYRYRTSPTMIELSRALPGGLDTVSNKVRSPLHLENIFRGYTGTLGRYFMMASDELVRNQMNYPLPPEYRTGDYPVTGRFLRGDEPRRTRYEEEVYRLIRRTAEVQGSLRFLERTDQEMRFEDIQVEFEPYIRVADDLEDIREDVSDINKSIMEIYVDEDMDPKEKRNQIDELQEDKNMLFELGYSLRPGGQANPIEGAEPITQKQILNLIDNFGVDDQQAQKLENTNPETFDLANGIQDMTTRNLESLARQ